MIVLSFNLQGSFFFNEYLLEAKRLERSQEGEKGGVVYAWAEYYLQPAFWLLGRSRLCHSWALLGSVTSPGGTRQLFSTVCSENEARENALNWLGWFAFKEFLIDDIAHEQTIICREGYNLVPRVFVPYCACWLDETSDRWSRGTKTLGTRVGRIGKLIADHAVGFPNEREENLHRMITGFAS